MWLSHHQKISKWFMTFRKSTILVLIITVFLSRVRVGGWNILSVIFPGYFRCVVGTEGLAVGSQSSGLES